MSVFLFLLLYLNKSFSWKANLSATYNFDCINAFTTSLFPSNILYASTDQKGKILVVNLNHFGNSQNGEAN